jgi:hypothetical protein
VEESKQVLCAIGIARGWRWIDRPGIFEEHCELQIGAEDVLAEACDPVGLCSTLLQELFHAIMECIIRVGLLL